MNKSITVEGVIAGSGLWSFADFALAAGDQSRSHPAIAALFRLAGLAAGSSTYRRRVRAAEGRGIATKDDKLDAAARTRAHSEEGL